MMCLPTEARRVSCERLQRNYRHRVQSDFRRVNRLPFAMGGGCLNGEKSFAYKLASHDTHRTPWPLFLG